MIRRIEPYYYESLINCKKRWLGRTVPEVITTEFKAQSGRQHLQAVQEHRVYLIRNRGTRSGEFIIAGEKDLDETFIQQGDLLYYKVHWHEPPIVDPGELEIIVGDNEGEGLIAVNKPTGIPVHPAGRYRHNCLTELLQIKLGYKVYASHRLDRLTSGLLIVARTSQAASRFSEKLRDRNISKEYLARVVGKFPSEQELIECDYPLFDLDCTSDRGGHQTFSHSVANWKNCVTVFQKVGYNSTYNYSVVKCIPHTGRMHQIRKHLAMLGYPIENDPLYRRQVFEELAMEVYYNQDTEKAYELYSKLLTETQKEKGQKQSNSPLCQECGSVMFSDNPSEGIYLHALKYKALDASWTYETPYPHWALL